MQIRTEDTRLFLIAGDEVIYVEALYETTKKKMRQNRKQAWDS